MKYTIKSMKVFETAKDGQPLIDKRGQPFKRVFLEFGADVINDKDWVGSASYLDYHNDSDAWQQNTELEGDLVKRVVGDKIFWNFYKLRETDVLAKKVAYLEERMEALEKKLESGDSKDKPLPF